MVAPTRRHPPSGTLSTRTSTGLTSSPHRLLRRPRPPRSLLPLLLHLPVRSPRLPPRRPRSASTTRRRLPKRRPSASARRRRRRPLRRPRRRRGRARPLRRTATPTEQLPLCCELSIISARQQHHVAVRSISDVHDISVHLAHLSVFWIPARVAYGKSLSGAGVMVWHEGVGRVKTFA